MLLWVLLLPPFLLALVAVSLYLPPVQDLLRGKAIIFLEGKIGTPVGIERITLRYPLGIGLQGVYLPDQQGDTLLYLGHLKARVSPTGLLKNEIALGTIVLGGVRANIRQGADSTFNFDHILAAFASSDTTPSDTSGGWTFDIGGLELEDVDLTLALGPSGLDLDLQLGTLDLALERIDPASLLFAAKSLSIADTRIALRTTPGPSAPDTYPLLENPTAGLAITLEELDLEQVAFTLVDKVRRDSLWIEVPRATVTVRELDLARQLFHLARVHIEAPRFGMITSVADHTPTRTDAPAWSGRNDGFRFWLRDRDIAVDELEITGADFALHENAIMEPQRLFDPAHLQFTGTDLKADSLILNNERIGARFQEVVTQSGGHQFSTALELHARPDAIRISNGMLSTGKQRIDFQLSAEPADLDAASRSPRTVPLRAEVRSSIDPEAWTPLLKDLGIAVPGLDRITETLDTQLGYVGSLTTADSVWADITGDQGSRIALLASMQDLGRLPQAPFTMDLSEVRMGPALRTLMHQYVPANVPLPHTLTGHLYASGDGRTITSDLHLKSDLGKIKGHVEAQGLTDRLPDAAQFELDIADLRVDRFTNDTTIGSVDLRLTGSAEHLNTPARRSGHVEVVPSDLHYHGHDLSSLRLNTTVHGDSLHGLVTLASEPVALQLIAQAHWPANDSLSALVDLRVARAKLQELGFLTYPLDVRGDLKGSATITAQGTGHYALIGEGLTLANAKKSFTFREFDALGLYSGDSTSVVLKSDGLELEYRTNVALDSLMPRTQEKLASFFSVDSSFTPLPGKRMELRLALPNSAWLTGLAVPDLEVIELEEFTGTYDSDADQLDIGIDLPRLEYAGIRLDATQLEVKSLRSDLRYTLTVERATYDSMYIDRLAFRTDNVVGALNAALSVGGTEDPRYNIPVRFARKEGALEVHFEEGLILDRTAWTADPQNVLRLLREGVEAEHFTLSGDGQSVALITSERSTTAKLEQFRTGTLLNFISTADSVPVAEGVLSGTVALPRDGNSGPEADLDLKGLKFRGGVLGDLSLEMESPTALQHEIDFNLRNDRNALDGKASIDRSGAKPDITADLDIGLKDLGILRPFTKELLERPAGAVEGELRFTLREGRTSLDGDIAFKQVQTVIKPIGSLFKLQDERLRFDDTGLHLRNFTLRDTADNRFVLDGDLLTKDYTAFIFDLRLRTERFQLAQSAKGASELFYGEVIAGIDLRLTGTDREPTVVGDLAILPGTDLSVILPGSKVEIVKHDGVVVFASEADSVELEVKSDAEVLRDSLKSRLPEVELDLGIRVDPAANFAVVLNPVTGDQATFRGTGDLHLNYSRSGDLALTGPFTVEEGGYTLEFYGLVKKRFDLVKGSSVTWSGDPLGAQMDIKARYISNSAPYPLVANSEPGMSEEQRNRLQARLPFEVIIGIDGAVDRPDITFGLDLERNYRNSYPQVANELERLAQSGQQEERNKQVFGLLVLNSFIQDEGAGGAPSSSIASSAARNSVNGILTDQMNKLTGKFIKGVDIQLGVNTYDQMAGNAVYQRTSVDYKVSKSFLNERLSFEVGGSVGVDEQNRDVSNVSNTRAAQYAILYDLTKDGRFRLRGFHENAFDLYDGEITDSGIALMYTKEIEENQRARETARELERQRRKAQQEVRKSEEEKARQQRDSLRQESERTVPGP